MSTINPVEQSCGWRYTSKQSFTCPNTIMRTRDLPYLGNPVINYFPYNSSLSFRKTTFITELGKNLSYKV